MAGHFYFYVDSEGKKQGPASKGEINELVAHGVIKPDTQMEYADDGYKFKAGKHPDLKFSSDPSAAQSNLGEILAYTNRTLTTIGLILLLILVLEYGPKLCVRCGGKYEGRINCEACDKTGWVWGNRILYGGPIPMGSIR